MGAEHDTGRRITRIALDLDDLSLTVANQDTVLARVTLAREGLIFQTPIVDDLQVAAVADVEEIAIPVLAESLEPEPREAEKKPTVTLEGKLKTKPSAGRPDRRGNPTACARFAAHVEGEDQAHMYFATFHRHTAGIALGLAPNTSITVEGYPHAGDGSEGRLDTLSVIHLADYPGKPNGK